MTDQGRASEGPGRTDDTILDRGVGEQDHLQRLWTPYRMNYLAEAPLKRDNGKDDQPFSEIPQLPDEDGLVVARGELVYAVLNLYPYNPGHLMVAPYMHTGDLPSLPAEVAAAVTSLSQQALRVLQAVLAPEGYNLGFNLGRVAGAGVIDHLHQHVVPRWNGDTNYMPVLAEVKVIPEHIDATYAKVRAGFDRVR